MDIKKWGFLILALSFLIAPGFLKVHALHQNPDNVKMMLLGEPSISPIYISNFIYPNEFPHFVNTPKQGREYPSATLLFPPNMSIVKATYKDVYDNDTVTIEYSGNDTYTVFTCDGTPLGPDQTMQSIYFIDAASNLACADVVNNRPLLSHAKVIIKNVEAMRVFYGLDSDGNGVSDDYINAQNSRFSLPNIVTIKIIFLLRTAKKDDNIEEYYALGKDPVGPYLDHYKRKILTLFLSVDRKKTHENVTQ